MCWSIWLGSSQHFLARIFTCIAWLSIQCTSTSFEALVCFEASHRQALHVFEQEIDKPAYLPGVLSNTRGSAPMSGFAFSSRTMSLKKTIILSLSHSGQTFPTLHATHTLRKLCGDRVFVVTGSVDSKMSAAVGQLSYVGAPWLARTWTTFAGNYPKHARTRTPTHM